MSSFKRCHCNIYNSAKYAAIFYIFSYQGSYKRKQSKAVGFPLQGVICLQTLFSFSL